MPCHPLSDCRVAPYGVMAKETLATRSFSSDVSTILGRITKTLVLLGQIR
jgi:hypothetical protein